MSFTSWGLSGVTASTDTDFITGTTGSTTFIRSMTICNYGTTDLDCIIKVVDEVDNEVAMIVSAPVTSKNTLFLDNMFISNSDKLVVSSTSPSAAFYASGDNNF